MLNEPAAGQRRPDPDFRPLGCRQNHPVPGAAGPGNLAVGNFNVAAPGEINRHDIISTAQLDEYLRFRHLVRNLYTWNFEADKLGNLVTGLPSILAALEGDLAAFGEFLEAASHADTSSTLQL